MGRTVGMMLVVGLAVGLTAGCSDEADPGAVDTTSAEDTSSEDDRSAVELEADRAAAEEIVLTLADFEPGWEASEDDRRADDAEMEGEIADCVGVDPERLYPHNPSATSPDFYSADDEEVSAEVTYTASAEAAESQVELLKNEDLPACIAEALGKLVFLAMLNPQEGSEPHPDDLEIGEPTVNQMSFASLGDDTVAYRMTIPFSTSGFDFDIYLEVVSVRVGRVGVTGNFESFQSPFPTDEAEELMAIMVDRVPADA